MENFKIENAEAIEKSLNSYSTRIRIIGIIGVILLIITIVSFILTFILKNDTIAIVAAISMLLLVFGGLGGSFYAYKQITGFSDVYKAVIGGPAIKAIFGDQARYDANAGFSYQEIEATKILNPYNPSRLYATSEDMIQATYSDIAFKQSDITVYREKGTKRDHELPDTVYEGRLTQFTLPYFVPHRILIAKNTGMELGIHTEDPKVQMEDMEFNDMFTVYCSDPHTVFYYLTPQFMAHLKQLYSNQLFSQYLSFDGSDLFYMRSGQGGIFKANAGKIDINEEVARAAKDLSEIKQVINILKINKDNMDKNSDNKSSGAVDMFGKRVSSSVIMSDAEFEAETAAEAADDFDTTEPPVEKPSTGGFRLKM